MAARLVVTGSLNMDFVVRVERLPTPGETALGHDFQMLPGGKGANQACAAAKLGHAAVTTALIGRAGHDRFADHLKASLAAAGVDVSHVHAAHSAPTGVALITVDHGGQNSIVVAPGANHALLAADIAALAPVFRGARFALFQLEIQLDAVSAGLRVAREQGASTILDPAPAQPLGAELLAAVDILTPNEAEACLLLGRAAGRIDPADAPETARALLCLGPRAVVLKLGDQGCFYEDGSRHLRAPAFPVSALDSTAAGDIFNAALAVALAEDQPIGPALRFANAAAAISVTRIGAQTSAPARAEVDAFLAAHAG